VPGSRDNGLLVGDSEGVWVTVNKGKKEQSMLKPSETVDDHGAVRGRVRSHFLPALVPRPSRMFGVVGGVKKETKDRVSRTYQNPQGSSKIQTTVKGGELDRAVLLESTTNLKLEKRKKVKEKGRDRVNDARTGRPRAELNLSTVFFQVERGRRKLGKKRKRHETYV